MGPRPFTPRQTVAAVLAAGATLFAVGALFHVALPVVAPGVSEQFADAELFRPWAGWTSAYMAVHPFAFAAPFAAGYLALFTRGGVGPGWRAGAGYGVGVFTVGAVPVYALVFASFRVSAEVVACWVAQAGCQYTLAGAVVGAVVGSVKSPSRPGG